MAGNACTGGPTEYQANTNANFAGAAWLAYATAPSFTLSTGDGEKRVYFKVRNDFAESEAEASDTITAVAPAVTTFAINNGATSTDSRTVTLNNACTGSPTEYMASTNADFAGAMWLDYSTAPSFTLSTGYGEKTVYFKTRNGFAESAAASDTIVAGPPGLVLISGGTNGGTDPDFGAYSLTVESFYMDQCEVTKALWDEVRTWAWGNGYTDLPTGGGKAANHPVPYARWYECVKWCNARSQKAGRTPVYYTDAAMTRVYKTGTVIEPYVKTSANGYRLPTEVQWEYAARGGVANRRFPWGDEINHDFANYSANGSAYTYDTSPYTTYTYHPAYNDGTNPYTSPVGLFAPNGYGLYDMAGNESEWCYAWFPGLEGSSRMMRGGKWYSGAYTCRVDCRSGSSGHSGFRVVLPPGQQ